MNILELKRDLRAANKKRKAPYPDHMSMVPVWGPAARKLCRNLLGYSSRRRAWLHFHPLSFGQHVVEVAKAEVGTKEHPPGSNDGGRVHLYQKTTGAFRQPWCASFRMWCEQEAAKRMGRHLGWFTNPAWVPNWTAAFGGKLYAAVAFNDAQAGDVVTLWKSEHIETVVERQGDYLAGSGGNTSPVGQNANGGMVARTRRHRSEVTKIGRRR